MLCTNLQRCIFILKGIVYYTSGPDFLLMAPSGPLTLSFVPQTVWPMQITSIPHHTYPDVYKVASKIIGLTQFWAADIPLSVWHISSILIPSYIWEVRRWGSKENILILVYMSEERSKDYEGQFQKESEGTVLQASQLNAPVTSFLTHTISAPQVFMCFSRLFFLV